VAIERRVGIRTALLASLVFSISALSAIDARGAESARTLVVDDLNSVKHVSVPRISPDGNWVAYAITEVDVKADESRSDIWLTRWDGSETAQLTATSQSEHSPRWAPDGKRLAFLSTGTDPDAVDQLWLVDAKGGKPDRVTSLANGVTDFDWAPDSRRIVLISGVAPEGSDAESTSGPIVIDRMLFKRDGYGYLGKARSRLHLLDLADKSVTVLTDGPHDEIMPSFSPDGRILLAERHRVALSPDGHGGSLLALAETGTLADMAARGIEHISYFQVDNPLVHCLDPAFIGLHATTDSEMSSKAVSKADDRERVGNFVMADGKLRVIEYSDLPDGLATARDAGGHRTYDAGSIAIHVISRAFIERLTADRRRFGLPWHRANKKVPCIDVETGHLVAPAEPNAVKLEAFIFDALPLANNPVVLETAREEEFSPVKNATGVDSVETARRDMSRRAAAWIERAGGDVPRDANGSPQYTYEISSLAALDSDQLAERTPLRLTPDAQGRVYIDGLP